MRNPKVTVTMPAYNAEKFITEAIESVLASDYDNFELLIADDGSKDKTLEIIKSYSVKSSKIRWFTKKHEGIAVTRNSLLALARGTYISICDADDKILPDKLKEHVRILDRYPKAAVVYGDILVMDESGHIKEDQYYKVHDLNNWWDLLETAVMHCGATFRKEAALSIGGYDPLASPSEDYDLWLKLAEKFKFKYLPEVVAIYRNYPQSASKRDPKVLEKVVRVKKNAILRRYGEHLASQFTW